MLVSDDTHRAAMLTLAPARQIAYSFLSGAFSRPPTAEQLSVLRCDSFLSAAREVFREDTVARLREHAKACEVITEVQQQTRQEFMNLFKVPGASYVAPYESVFRDTRDVAGQQVKGLLMGQSTVDVQKWYRLAALEFSEECKDLPDHICLELDYLAHLCSKEAKFGAEGDAPRLTRAWEMERDFLAAHVVSWVSMLRDKIHGKSQNAYFRAVTDMAVDFTHRDLATLEQLLGPSPARAAPNYEKVSYDTVDA